MSEKIKKDDSEWRRELTPEQYRIARQKGTEAPFSGEYYHNQDAGIYRCTCCGAGLFGSETKYDSGSGWASFYAPMKPDNVSEAADNSHGLRRLEILCSRCDAHLGHVFEDGPEPTGLRYCVNSISLRFAKK